MVDSEDENNIDSMPKVGKSNKEILTKLEDTRESAKHDLEGRILKIDFQILEHESRLTSLTKEADNLKSEIGTLKTQVAELKKKTRPLRRHSLYLIIFAVLVLVTGFLVAYGWAEKPTVSITYNVGDIIGGLLVGIAAVLASIFYVRSRDSRGE
jgi:polyhydroxyalkanoate synthesis regulator phasin